MHDLETPLIGLILAAGRSSRMGRPKALIDVSGQPAVMRLIGQLAELSCSEIRVVLGFSAGEIERAVDLSSVRVIRNPDPGRGQTSSLQTGLADLPDEASTLMCPVDHAAVRPETFRMLRDAYLGRPEGIEIVLPSCQGRRGHPLLFTASIRRELLDLTASTPAHSVVRRDPRRVLHVETEDLAVVRDFDRPEDLPGRRPGR